MKKEDKGKAGKELDPTAILGGTLNILGLKIDLGKMLASPEDLAGRLEELREKLKAAGGKEGLSDEAWRRGDTGVGGHILVRGPSGEREFHVGTLGRPGRQPTREPAPEAPEPSEPPVDVFDEGPQVTIVADVPGVGLEDLELKVQGDAFSLSTKPAARRSYRKDLPLSPELDPDSLKATCRNGVLEVHVRKKRTARRRS